MLKVNPTRINLLNLKKRLVSAKRGHKLLKDKRDGLMRRFLESIKIAWKLRNELEIEMDNIKMHYFYSELTMLEDSTLRAIHSSIRETEIVSKPASVMSVKIPSFEIIKSPKVEFLDNPDTSPEFRKAVNLLEIASSRLIQLAESEEKARLLAEEIEKTRRRVNALEYILIPNLEETVKFIYMRLEEQGRDAVVGTMRVKAMIEAKAAKSTA